MRPLPGPLLALCEGRHHFLLYIYDRLKMELSARRSEVLDSVLEDMPPNYPKDLVGAVLWQSAVISLQMYEKPAFTETSYLDYYYKQRVTFDPKQLAVFAGLFAWRDAKARDLDESPRPCSLGPSSWTFPAAQRRQTGTGTTPRPLRFTWPRFAPGRTTFRRPHQEEVCEVIASSVKQDISHGSKRVSGPSAERGGRLRRSLLSQVRINARPAPWVRRPRRGRGGQSPPG